MSWTEDDYRRLGEQMRAARRQLGFRNLRAFQEYLDSDEASDLSGRTYADIENGRLGKRKSFSGDTLAFLEDLFDWFPGACRAILDNRTVDVYSGIEISAPANARARVGADPQDGDSLLFSRPEGLSDEAWERLQDRQREHWEWLIDRASKER